LAVVAARYWGTRLLLGRSTTFSDWDKASVALMFPLGLAAAVVSTIPSQRFGLDGTERFPDYAVVAIILTNLVAALLVFVLSMRNERRNARLAAPVGEPVAGAAADEETRAPASKAPVPPESLRPEDQGDAVDDDHE
jgi:hypothetical protein